MRYCSFCGRSERDCNELFTGIKGELICGECIRAMNDELNGAAPAPEAGAEGEAAAPAQKPLPKPKEIMWIVY